MIIKNNSLINLKNIFWLILFLINNAFAIGLYPGEAIQNFAGYPCLVKLTLASNKKPLVVLIPGDANLARVFYGYPKGDPKDFIEYWLNNKGYSTLAISYPTDNAVFGKEAYPFYSIHDWAKQAAFLTKETIDANHLSNQVILVVWSMGGIITANYNKFAKDNGLNVIAMALSATPPIPNLIVQQEATVKFNENGLSARVDLRKDRFLQFLAEENAINHKVVIPDNIYSVDFLGNTPVALLNTACTPVHEKINKDAQVAQKDSMGLSFKDYPLTGVIHGDLESDMQHVIADQYTWMFLNQQSIFNNYFSEKNLFLLSHLNKGKIVHAINHMETNMSCTVRGGHFFFVGQYGAQKTVNCIDHIYGKINDLQTYLVSFS